MKSTKVSAIALVTIVVLIIGKFTYDYNQKQKHIKFMIEYSEMMDKMDEEEHQIMDEYKFR